jgi:DsbC/DsbD-like thiol-disulfide interchange protein
MTRALVFILALVLLLLSGFSACSQRTSAPVNEAAPTETASTEAKRVSSVNVVQATPKFVELSRGDTAELVITLKIQDGYHVNANPPTFPYLKATKLEIPTAEGISASDIKYPPPVTKKFAFADKPLAVYEGETQLRVTLNADRSAPFGERALKATLQVQACDDQVCYPPGTINLSVPIAVK